MLAVIVAASAASWAALVFAQATPAASSAESVVWSSAPAFVLVIGLVEVLKRAGLPSRWAGVAAVLLGLAGGVSSAMFGELEIGMHTGIMQGIMVGLAASGAWSGARAAADGSTSWGYPRHDDDSSD